jgi:hypothetical protein
MRGKDHHANRSQWTKLAFFVATGWLCARCPFGDSGGIFELKKSFLPTTASSVDNSTGDLNGESVEVAKDDGEVEADTGLEEEELQQVRERPEPKPAKPSIMGCFACKHGFRKDHDNRFFHSDGSWIEKSDDVRFWDRPHDVSARPISWFGGRW